MKAIRVCVSTAGILYIDQQYRCWVFEKAEDVFTPLKEGLPLTEYTTCGYGNVSGGTIAVMLAELMCQLFDYSQNFTNPLDYVIIGDVREEMAYIDTPQRWYDQLVFHHCLVKEWVSDVIFIRIVRCVNYDTYDGLLVWTNDETMYSLVEVTPLTDAEIDALKPGPLSEDWYLHPCNREHNQTDVDTKDYVDFIIGHNADDNTFSDEEEDGLETAIPLTDTELDAFKIRF